MFLFAMLHLVQASSWPMPSMPPMRDARTLPEHFDIKCPRPPSLLFWWQGQQISYVPNWGLPKEIICQGGRELYRLIVFRQNDRELLWWNEKIQCWILRILTPRIIDISCQSRFDFLARQL